MKIYVKKVEGITLPERGSELAAGYDIIATSDPKIVGEQNFNYGMDGVQQEATGYKRIDYIQYETNLYIAPETVTHYVLIHPRSSISKYNLVLANSIGLIDNDYRGMVMCRFKYIWQPEDMISTSCWPNTDKIYKKGDKIAQLVAEQTIHVEWVSVDELQITQRGSGGFGSTDKKIVSGPVPFDETSNMAERFRKLNYTEPTYKKYEDIMREQQK